MMYRWPKSPGILLPLLGALALLACNDQPPPPETPTPEVTQTATEQPEATPRPTVPPTDAPTAIPTEEPTLPPTPLEDLDKDGYTSQEGDCDDQDDTIHPQATEIPYDGIDQDCSGEDMTDVDGDGYPGGALGEAVDCDDLNANTWPGALELGDGKDNDCDGEVDEGVDSVDNDGDGLSELGGDCNDEDANIHPQATDIPYDGIDQDCSGMDLTDVDGDGYPGGLDGTPADCDDASNTIHPGAQEVPYDGIDQDCDGQDLNDLDQDGVPGAGDSSPLDCDDKDPARAPGFTEVAYDGIDQDCSGSDLTDVDEDGYPALQAGGTDCDDLDDSISPAMLEVPYDDIDQDCSGADLTDVDGDGYTGAPADSIPAPEDCDDEDASTYPGAVEYADGRDNDCDGKVDEGLNTTDDDQDGYSEAQGDCQDADPTIHPGADEIPYDGLDQDCVSGDLIDVDGDGYAADVAAGSDCDDLDENIYPGAPETPYDGIDQSCLAGDLVDVDQDGYASSLVPGGDDCDDQSAQIYPAAPEVPYDGIDQDCSGTDLTDVDGDGNASTVVGGMDCNDADAAVKPGAAEYCDNIDNNCDGTIDADALDRVLYHVDSDHDLYGDPDQTVLVCTPTSSQIEDGTDCDDSTAITHPGAPEICDQADNNCDGTVDEGVTTLYAQDLDGDTYGNASVTKAACATPAGYVQDQTDCDDTQASVHPGGTELCNGMDDDCDASIDEGVKLTFYYDGDGDGYGTSSQTTQACQVPAGYASASTDCNDANGSVSPGQTEVANGADDDCDGQTDEGVYFSSCSTLKTAQPSLPSGIYSIDPDGAGSVAAFDAYCDMTTDGGGWTLVLNLDTSDGHVMWWGNALWTDDKTRGTPSLSFTGDLKSPAWNSYGGATRILLVVHEQGTYRGWKSFAKTDGKTMFQYLQGGDNTLIGKSVTASSISSLSTAERLVRLSTALYANHCMDIYGTGCSKTTSTRGPDGDRIGSHEGTPRDNTGGGLGNWHDMGGCCSGSYAGIACTGLTWRTTSEAQGGWAPCYGTGGEGTFGSDSFAPPSQTCGDSSCSASNWAKLNGINYDYAIFLAGP